MGNENADKNIHKEENSELEKQILFLKLKRSVACLYEELQILGEWKELHQNDILQAQDACEVALGEWQVDRKNLTEEIENLKERLQENISNFDLHQAELEKKLQITENDIEMQKSKLQQKDLTIERLISSEANLKTRIENMTNPRIYAEAQMQAFKTKEESVYETLEFVHTDSNKIKSDIDRLEAIAKSFEKGLLEEKERIEKQESQLQWAKTVKQQANQTSNNKTQKDQLNKLHEKEEYLQQQILELKSKLKEYTAQIEQQHAELDFATKKAESNELLLVQANETSKEREEAAVAGTLLQEELRERNRDLREQIKEMQEVHQAQLHKQLDTQRAMQQTYDSQIDDMNSKITKLIQEKQDAINTNMDLLTKLKPHPDSTRKSASRADISNPIASTNASSDSVVTITSHPNSITKRKDTKDCSTNNSGKKRRKAVPDTAALTVTIPSSPESIIESPTITEKIPKKKVKTSVVAATPGKAKLLSLEDRRKKPACGKCDDAAYGYMVVCFKCKRSFHAGCAIKDRRKRFICNSCSTASSKSNHH